MAIIDYFQKLFGHQVGEGEEGAGEEGEGGALTQTRTQTQCSPPISTAASYTTIIRRSDAKRVLLVEPDFPFPTSSKNRAGGVHQNFVPVGLLKLGALYKSWGWEARLVRGRADMGEWQPDKILVTSIFTYWQSYVWDAIAFYRSQFPDVEIEVGGIYVTLCHGMAHFQENVQKYGVKFHVGLHEEADTMYADYSLIDTGHAVIHGMRGCVRHCTFCFNWRTEPLCFKTAEEIKKEIEAAGKEHVIFFDNNFLANPNAKDILRMLPTMKLGKKKIKFEAQSGFDGRLMEKEPEFATLIAQAGLKPVRIAWDGPISDWPSIENQLNMLIGAGVKPLNIFVFVLFNHDIPFEDCCFKLEKLREKAVRVAECRFRPLTQLHDRFKGGKKPQTKDDYYIHEPVWNDHKVRWFARLCHIHNGHCMVDASGSF